MGSASCRAKDCCKGKLLLMALILACNLGIFLPSLTPELWAMPEVLPVTTDMELVNATGHLELLVDPQQKLLFEDVLRGAHDREFQKTTRLSYSFLMGSQWFLGRLENKSAEPQSVYFQFDLGSHITMQLLSLGDGRAAPRVEGGWKMPFQGRAIPFLHPTFEVKVPPGLSRFVIKNEGSGFFMNIGSKPIISNIANRFEFLLVFCQATFIALGIFNLFIFFRTGDRAYLYYFFRCISITLLTLFSYNVLTKDLLPESTWNHRCWEASLIAVTYFTWIVVTRKFLPLDLYFQSRVLDSCVWAIGIALLVAGIFPWVFPESEPQTLLRIVGSFSFLGSSAMGVYVCFKKNRSAYFYMLAAIAYVAGVTTIILACEGAITVTPASFLAPSIGGALEALLMSFGLGDKYLTAMKLSYQALTERNVELDRDLSMMLHSLDQGLCSINSNGTINPEYSVYLKTIFSDDNIAGADAFEFLFKGTDYSQDYLAQIKCVVLLGFGEDSDFFLLNGHILPRKYVRQTASGSRRQTLEIDWRPLLNEAEHCYKLMVVVRDVSELEALQKEKEKNRRDLEIIGQVLSGSVPNFKKFSEDAASRIQQNILEIEKSLLGTTLNISLLFRNIHTIKGNARVFGLHSIAAVAHRVENYLNELKIAKGQDPDNARLLRDLRELEAVHDEYIQIVATRLIVAGETNADDLIIRLQELHKNLPNLDQIKERFFDLGEMARIERFYPQLEVMLTTLIRGLERTADDLGKPAPIVAFAGEALHLDVALEGMLRNVFSQILGNAIDHGIESPAARLKLGKDAKGKITIETIHGNQEFMIIVRDDGAGLNLIGLTGKSLKATAGDSEIAASIFEPGVSTAVELTQFSGRGVGMDIIRDQIQAFGGTIRLDLIGAKDSEGRQPFQLVLTFPITWARHGQLRTVIPVAV